MKLLTAPRATIEEYETTFNGMISKVAGRQSIGNVVIQAPELTEAEEMWDRLKDEPVGQLILGKKEAVIKFNSITLFGVMPIEQQDDHYECTVDQFSYGDE